MPLAIRRPRRDVDIVVPPRPAPRRPAPTVRIPREEIASVSPPPAPLKFSTLVVIDSRIVAVSLEHRRTEGEERRTRNAVVLENDRFLTVLKHPIQTGRHSSLASQVLGRKIRQQFAGPVG